MMFACVTPLLITGTVAERMRWQPFLLFMLGFEVCTRTCAHTHAYAPSGTHGYPSTTRRNLRLPVG
jgi:ammonia channel protein AmtB